MTKFCYSPFRSGGAAYLSVYRFQAGTLLLLNKAVALGTGQPAYDLNLRRSSTYRLRGRGGRIVLDVKPYVDYAAQSFVLDAAEEQPAEAAPQVKKATLPADPAANMGEAAGAKRDWQSKVERYHQLLRAGNWSEIADWYADRLMDYYGQGTRSAALALADHQEYFAKYRIERQQLVADELKIRPLADGRTEVTYPLRYDITRRSNAKRYGYYLSAVLVFDRRGKIVRVNSEILKRFPGGSPSGTQTLQATYGEVLTGDDEAVIRAFAADYHNKLERSDYLGVMQYYADEVAYYKFGRMDKAAILTDHRTYFEKFTGAFYEIDPESWIIRRVPTGIELTYSMRYGVIRKRDGKRLNFRLNNQLTLNAQGKIALVNSTIRERY